MKFSLKVFGLFWVISCSLFFANSVAQTPQDSAPPPADSAFKGGYSQLSQKFVSYSFETKREVQVKQEGLIKTRWDKVILKRDDLEQIHFKKTSSIPKGNVEFYWAKQKAYRPDIEQYYDRLSAQIIFQPIMDKTTAYWEDFWQSFKHNYTWKKEGGAKWEGRLCDRYTLSSPEEEEEIPKNHSGDSPEKEVPKALVAAKIEGEVLVDQETGLVVKSKIKANYKKNPTGHPISEEEQAATDPESLSLKPFEVQIILQEKLEKINKMAALKIPGALKEETTSPQKEIKTKSE